MPRDRQGLTVIAVDQLAPRPQSTEEARRLLAEEREAARLALHRLVVQQCPEEGREKALNELVDMLGLRTTRSDVEFGYDRRSPQRPHLTPQLPAGGETDVNGMQKRYPTKTSHRKTAS